MKVYTINEVARLLYKFCGDAPCSYNDYDKYVNDWCADHCLDNGNNGDYTECWVRALQEGWLDGTID